MSLFACGSIHLRLDPEHFSDKCRGRREIYICLAALFAYPRMNGGVKISIKLSFMEMTIESYLSVEAKGKLAAMDSKCVIMKNLLLLN